jgi:tetratricopeptide (TPR) repeat protein
VLSAQGNLAQALDSYSTSLAIRERLAAADRGNAGWQRDLSVSQDKIGDMLRAQGNLAQALDSYSTSLAIRERLAATDPGNAGWQRDLATSHERIGDMARLNADPSEAIAAFERALAIYEALLARYPDNIQFLTFSVVPRLRLGTLQGPGGRPHLERALQILKTLDAEDRLDANRKGWIAQGEAQLAG